MQQDPDDPSLGAAAERPQPVFALFTLALVYAALVAVLVGFAVPLRLVFARHELDPPQLCAQVLAAGEFVATPIGAATSVAVLAMLLFVCARVVPAARRSRAAWTAAVAVMLVTGTALVGVWLPTSKLAAALERGAAPR